MAALTPDDLTAALQWRYATKQFDPEKKIPDAAWAALEQSLVLAPSSFGLQPWRFIVVTDPALKAQFPAMSWGQAQPAECSHFVVFARQDKLSAADVDAFIALTASARGAAVESLAGYKQVMLGFRQNAEDQGWLAAWADRQVYIALGTFMTAAAALGIDACPMEGIEPAKYDELLGLKGSGFSTLVACAAGYRAAGDKYATLAKVRYPASTLIVRK